VIEFSDENASNVMQNALDNLPNSGTVYVRQGTYTLTVSLSFKVWFTVLQFEGGTILQFGGNGYAIDFNNQSFCKILGFPEIYLTSSAPAGAIRLGTSVRNCLVEVQRVHADTITTGQVGIKMERESGGGGYCYLNKIVAFDFWNLDIGIDLEVGANANDITLIGSTGRSINTWMQIASVDNRIKLFAASGTNGLNLTGSAHANSGWVYFEPLVASGVGITFDSSTQNNVFEMAYLGGISTNPTHPEKGNEVYIHNMGWKSSKHNSGFATVANGEYIAHGISSIANIGAENSTVQVTPYTATYDNVPVVVGCPFVNGTHIQVSVYWINGTAIADDAIQIWWYVAYKQP
jgi:hypothetical protein